MFKGDDTSSKQLLRTYVKMKDEDVDEGEDVFFVSQFMHTDDWFLINIKNLLKCTYWYVIWSAIKGYQSEINYLKNFLT